MRRFKGFTLIETVLVLAVAGAILVMVFIGVPALTASQRDTVRKDHMLTFINQLKNFQANNNRGALPVIDGTSDETWVMGSEVVFGNNNGNTWADFYGGYLEDSFVDPDGTRYDLFVTRCAAEAVGSECTNEGLDEPTLHTLYVVRNATCSGINAVYSSNPRGVAVIYKMERSDKYCADTQGI